MYPLEIADLVELGRDYPQFHLHKGDKGVVVGISEPQGKKASFLYTVDFGGLSLQVSRFELRGPLAKA